MKKNINDYGSRRLMILSIFAIVFITDFSSTYALYNYNKTGGNNTIQTGTVSILFTEPSTDTTLTTYYLSDEDATASDNYVEFSVTANSTGLIATNYYIYFTENESNTVENSHVKMHLTEVNGNEEIEVVPVSYANTFTQINLNTLQEDTTSGKHLLHDDKFIFLNAESRTRTYRLRMWMDDEGPSVEYSGTSENDRTHTAVLSGEYSIKLNVYANQDVD